MTRPLLLSHRAHGYNVWANRRVSALNATRPESGPSIDVRLQEQPEFDHPAGATPPFYVSPFRSPEGEPALRVFFDASREMYRLRSWDGTDCFVHASGQQLWMNWPERVADPEEFLVGTCLGLAFRLREELCLHASGVVMGGRAVLFAGQSHAGKSTIAAALAVRGLDVITDDMAVVTPAAHGFEVQPGGGRLRLRPEAVSIVDAGARRKLAWAASPGGAYVDLLLEQSGMTQPSDATPVEAIYLLEPDPHAGSSPREEAVPRADALIALVADSWAARLQNRAMRQREFERAADLVDHVRLARIRYRPELNADAVCDFMTHELAPAGIAGS